ncbi:carboxysome shell carbonic anhydrase [Prochlorococcus sp. MIT 1223]|uniref:carboxysome shell carbonic anhydrase n=1 Tax=Prochlorococcus sp. MIT 1223 TaxID=3096217 RepID=UPI002A75A193|nr:carboxysome shell carbonic anhydrase [Prochlorococcus sp. MIT 1223]
MAYRRPLAKDIQRIKGPTAPRKRFENFEETRAIASETIESAVCHPLTNTSQNKILEDYEHSVKGSFDKIVPVLKSISSIQNSNDFILQAQKLAIEELGFELPLHVLEKAWVRPLDMRALFAWSVFQAHQKASAEFFNSDPLNGSEKSPLAKKFQSFLLECGFHLLDVTPCSDGRLAHSIAYAMRIPFSSVRRRSHAGALFDIERTVNRWIKTEHKRFRENMPNEAHTPTRYLKVVTYHFSSIDPKHQGCAAHGSDDVLAAKAGFQRLLDFRKAVENSFCCGASVDLLLIGLDTDTDSIRIHVPDKDSKTDLSSWVSSQDLYRLTHHLSASMALKKIKEVIKQKSTGNTEVGMINFIAKLIENNFSQIDYVRHLHSGPYPDAGHAERFIGVGIGFKEVHLRNLTYFAHLDTVEEGAPDLDVGIKIFKGLNVIRDLPIPVVIRFDYSGRVPGERERAIDDCLRVRNAISNRYRSLVDDGLLHTLLTIRDRDLKDPAEVVGSSLDSIPKEAH